MYCILCCEYGSENENSHRVLRYYYHDDTFLAHWKVHFPVMQWNQNNSNKESSMEISVDIPFSIDTQNILFMATDVDVLYL